MPYRRTALLHSWIPLAAALLAGCADVQPMEPVQARRAATLLSQDGPEGPLPPKLTSSAPHYPVVAQYIIYREFVRLHKDAPKLIRQGEPYWQYVEKRLMELYPGTGYRGMVRDAHEGMRRYRAAWADYDRRRRQFTATTSEPCGDYDYQVEPSCPTEPTDPYYQDVNPYGYDEDASWAGQTESEPDPNATPTLQQEFDHLQMTAVEQDEMYYYESLAWETSDGYQPMMSASSRDEAIRTAAGPRRGDDVQAQWLIAGAAAAIGYGGYVYWRAKVTQDRAEQRSTAAFPLLARDNTQRDAHRHIFGNVMLRAYVGEAVTFAIATAHEARNPNLPVGHMMDFHNNDLGRSVKYKHFRGNFFTDFLQWENWSGRVARYVADTRNGEFISDWATDPGSISWGSAWDRKWLVPRWKYIYFSQASS